MKALFAALKNFCYRLRYVLILTGIVVLVAVCATVGWKVYKDRHSPEFALETRFTILSMRR